LYCTERSLVKAYSDLCEITCWSHSVCFSFCCHGQCSGRRRNSAENGVICSLQETSICRGGLWHAGTVIQNAAYITLPLINAVYYFIEMVAW